MLVLNIQKWHFFYVVMYLKAHNSLKSQHNYAIIFFGMLHTIRYKKIIVPRIPPGDSQLKVYNGYLWRLSGDPTAFYAIPLRLCV